MRLQGYPVTVDRALLANELRFEPDAIYRLEHHLMLMPGDQVLVDECQRVVINRVNGAEETPVGEWEPWCWKWRLL